VSLGRLGESRGAEQEECDDCLHTYIIGYFEAELKSFFEFFFRRRRRAERRAERDA
jgi:hypothetical protein